MGVCSYILFVNPFFKPRPFALFYYDYNFLRILPAMEKTEVN